VLVAVGLTTAWVTFGVLKSQASTTSPDYSLEGAIVGALAATSLFASIYLQIRKSSGTLEQLRQVNKELQRKLLKGAPCPKDFQREITENNDIVFARPNTWKPAEGDVFSFEAPSGANDTFPARVTLHIIPIERGGESGEPLYEEIRKKVLSGPTISKQPAPEIEKIWIGGIDGDEDRGVESLKILCYEYGTLVLFQHWFQDTPWTEWRAVTKSEYEAKLKMQSEDAAGRKASPAVWREIPCLLRIVRVFAYHRKLGKIYFFQLMDNPEDSMLSGAGFNRLLDTVRFLPRVE